MFRAIAFVLLFVFVRAEDSESDDDLDSLRFALNLEGGNDRFLFEPSGFGFGGGSGSGADDEMRGACPADEYQEAIEEYYRCYYLDSTVREMCSCFSELEYDLSTSCYRRLQKDFAVRTYLEPCERCKDEIQARDQSRDCNGYNSDYCTDNRRCYNKQVNYYLTTQDLRGCFHHHGVSWKNIDQIIPSYIWYYQSFRDYCVICAEDEICYYCDNFDAENAQQAYRKFQSACETLPMNGYDPSQSFNAGLSQLEVDTPIGRFIDFCYAHDEECETAFLDAFAHASVVEMCFHEPLGEDYLRSDEYYFPVPGTLTAAAVPTLAPARRLLSGPAAAAVEPAPVAEAAASSKPSRLPMCTDGTNTSFPSYQLCGPLPLGPGDRNVTCVHDTLCRDATGVSCKTMLRDMMSNGVCDPALNCSLYKYDKKECKDHGKTLPPCTDGSNTTSPAYQVCNTHGFYPYTCITEEVCQLMGYGTCSSMIKDNTRDGICDALLDCSLYNQDGGDCQGAEAAEDEMNAIHKYEEHSADVYEHGYQHPTSFDWALVVLGVARTCPNMDNGLNERGFSQAVERAEISLNNAISNSCPSLLEDEECSGRGGCKRGMCECKKGYYYLDCSQTQPSPYLAIQMDHPVTYTSTMSIGERERISTRMGRLLRVDPQRIVVSSVPQTEFSTAKTIAHVHVTNTGEALEKINALQARGLSVVTARPVTAVSAAVISMQEQLDSIEEADDDSTSAAIRLTVTGGVSALIMLASLLSAMSVVAAAILF